MKKNQTKNFPAVKQSRQTVLAQSRLYKSLMGDDAQDEFKISHEEDTSNLQETIRQLEKTVASLNHAYNELQEERNYLRASIKMIQEFQRKEVWYWQGDGEDHVESMVNDLPVVIRAYELRELIRSNNG